MFRNHCNNEINISGNVIYHRLFFCFLLSHAAPLLLLFLLLTIQPERRFNLYLNLIMQKTKLKKKTFITFPFSVSSICFHVLPPFYVVTRPSQYESKVQNLKKRKIMVNVSVDGVRVLLKKRKRKVSMEAWIIF